MLGEVIKDGKDILSIHIMEGEDLSPEETSKSLRYARRFFQDKFQYSHFFCWSWLLYRGNQDLLGKDSNIVKFTNLFQIIGEYNDPGMAVERIFGSLEEDIEINEDSTSLQKRAADNIEKLGVSAGIIKKSQIR